MTNKEKIKNMSTEKLAREIEFLISSCIFCPAFWTCRDKLKDKTCFEKIEEWLKEEAGE